MVKCIRELVLQGIAVKIDNLAIFSLGIKPKKGADSEDDFSVAKNVEGVRLRARATGNFTRESLDINASLKNYDSFVKGAGDDSPTTPSGGGGSTSQGSGAALPLVEAAVPLAEAALLAAEARLRRVTQRRLRILVVRAASLLSLSFLYSSFLHLSYYK